MQEEWIGGAKLPQPPHTSIAKPSFPSTPNVEFFATSAGTDDEEINHHRGGGGHNMKEKRSIMSGLLSRRGLGQQHRTESASITTTTAATSTTSIRRSDLTGIISPRPSSLGTGESSSLSPSPRTSFFGMSIAIDTKVNKEDDISGLSSPIDNTSPAMSRHSSFRIGQIIAKSPIVFANMLTKQVSQRLATKSSSLSISAMMDHDQENDNEEEDLSEYTEEMIKVNDMLRNENSREEVIKALKNVPGVVDWNTCIKFVQTVNDLANKSNQVVTVDSIISTFLQLDSTWDISAALPQVLLTKLWMKNVDQDEVLNDGIKRRLLFEAKAEVIRMFTLDNVVYMRVCLC